MGLGVGLRGAVEFISGFQFSPFSIFDPEIQIFRIVVHQDGTRADAKQRIHRGRSRGMLAFVGERLPVAGRVPPAESSPDFADAMRTRPVSALEPEQRPRGMFQRRLSVGSSIFIARSECDATIVVEARTFGPTFG